MELIQTYQGYFREDGQFVSDLLPIQLPIRRRAIVNILDEEIMIDEQTDSQKQKKALEHLYAGLSVIDDEPLDAAFDAIMGRRFNIGRALDL